MGSSPPSQATLDQKLSPASHRQMIEMLKMSSCVRNSHARLPPQRNISWERSTSNECSMRNRTGASNVYHSEVDFLIRNQAYLDSKDFEQILAVIAEDSIMGEKKKGQNMDNKQIHRTVVSTEERQKEEKRNRQEMGHLSLPNKLSPHKQVSSSDDLEALVVALNAEIAEIKSRKKHEEESLQLAWLLVKEEAELAHKISLGCSCGGSEEGEKEEDSSTDSESYDIQCRACYLDIENEESILVLRCGHHFHACCINRWLRMGKADCPFCRSPLSGCRSSAM